MICLVFLNIMGLQNLVHKGIDMQSALVPTQSRYTLFCYYTDRWYSHMRYSNLSQAREAEHLALFYYLLIESQT
jgi:hypothetical protein